MAAQPGSRPDTVVITDAQSGASRDLASRQKRYAITMGFRTLCFVCMIFVPGAWRWVLLAGAVFLPYVAVVLANQTNTRTQGGGPVGPGEPAAAPQLTEAAAPEIIIGATEDQPVSEAKSAELEPEPVPVTDDERR